MRTLTRNDVLQIHGGESSVIYFDLLPGVEVVGFEKHFLYYEVTEWTEYTGLFSSIFHHVETPVYGYVPLYDQTITYIQ